MPVFIFEDQALCNVCGLRQTDYADYKYMPRMSGPHQESVQSLPALIQGEAACLYQMLLPSTGELRISYWGGPHGALHGPTRTHRVECLPPLLIQLLVFVVGSVVHAVPLFRAHPWFVPQEVYNTQVIFVL